MQEFNMNKDPLLASDGEAEAARNVWNFFKKKGGKKMPRKKDSKKDSTPSPDFENMSAEQFKAWQDENLKKEYGKPELTPIKPPTPPTQIELLRDISQSLKHIGAMVQDIHSLEIRKSSLLQIKDKEER